MLYAFFWVIPRRLKFICRRFGTLCLFHLHRQVGVCRFYTRLPACEMEQTDCSETSAYKIQRPGNYPKESIQKILSVDQSIWLYIQSIWLYMNGVMALSCSGFMTKRRKISEWVGEKVEGGSLGLTWSSIEASGGINKNREPVSGC
jgi:hypothetical protein